MLLSSVLLNKNVNSFSILYKRIMLEVKEILLEKVIPFFPV